MAHATPGALVRFGWSERVATLVRSHPSATTSDPGRVVRAERASVLVVDPTGAERSFRPDGDPAVGDWVLVEGPRIRAVLDRWSVLERRDPGAGVQTLAADVDVVIVTVPGDRAAPGRAEREILLAWESGARPLVVVTKADLAPPGLAGELAARLAGVEVLAVSATTGDGVAGVGERLAPDRTGVLLGPSGAGKSTLTNALLGTALQATGEVREADARGRHTTTARQLLALPGGGVVIDTPGLRSLGLVGGEVDLAFPDVEELAGACRFADCAHAGEPGCAVAAAVGSGALAAERFDSYRKLARELESERRRTDPLARRAARQVWKQRTVDARRHDKRRGGR